MPSLRQVARRWMLAGLVASLVWVAPVSAAEIRVITSGAFTEAYKQLVPLYEAATGDKVISAFGASIGNAPDSIPSRLARQSTGNGVRGVANGSAKSTDDLVAGGGFIQGHQLFVGLGEGSRRDDTNLGSRDRRHPHQAGDQTSQHPAAGDLTK